MSPAVASRYPASGSQPRNASYCSRENRSSTVPGNARQTLGIADRGGTDIDAAEAAEDSLEVADTGAAPIEAVPAAARPQKRCYCHRGSSIVRESAGFPACKRVLRIVSTITMPNEGLFVRSVSISSFRDSREACWNQHRCT